MTSTMPMNPERSTSGLTLLDGLICLFLALPLLVFCAWFKWPVALALALIACYGFFRAVAGLDWRRLELKGGTVALAGVVALAWTALSGVGHFVFANVDWITRDAVLRDLAATSWPPLYSMDGGVAWILRAPVGFYLPVAAAGSLVGLHGADFLLYLWTSFGFTLVLWSAMSLFESRRERVICVLLMVAFGGLDLIGFPLTHGRMPDPGEHIEWWSGFAQYSSNSTLMFWVPNHALPAWLGLMMVLRHWRTPELARLSLLLAAAITLWSPLATVGLLPFYLVGLNWRRDLKVLLSVHSGLPFLALAALVGRYLTMDTESIGRGWAFDMFPSAVAFGIVYLLFCMLEFGLLTLVLLRLRAVDFRIWIAVAILALLPFYRFGPGNDLVMRCSIPALALLALACVRPLAASPRPFARAALMGILAVGALGAAQEPERALLARRWNLSGRSLAQANAVLSRDHGATLPPNYVGRLVQPGLQALLRAPAPVIPGIKESTSSPR
jgi:hypothetical protein